MQIIFFGGTFDPIHLGHLAIAKRVVERFPCSGILFAPSYIPPHKNFSALSPFPDRYRMTELAISGMENLEVSAIEHEREKSSYTLDTLRILRKRFPGKTISFLIGSDSLMQLHSWHESASLVREFPVIVYPRSGVHPEREELRKFWPEEETEKLLSVVLKDVPLFPVSSTSIKAMYRSGQGSEAEKFLPESVAAYIREHGLYRPETQV